MTFLSKAEIEEKNRKFKQLEDSVEEFYAKNGEQIVSSMLTSRGLPSAMRGTFDWVVAKRDQRKSNPVSTILGRPGRDSVDNAALLP